jgi:hypothetical protein
VNVGFQSVRGLNTNTRIDSQLIPGHLAEGQRMRDRKSGAQFRPKGEQVLDEVVLIGERGNVLLL